MATQISREKLQLLVKEQSFEFNCKSSQVCVTKEVVFGFIKGTVM